ncbi:SseB family protein [Gemmiger formicilis]|nr:SseB family protein [Gemmiger formicilis]
MQLPKETKISLVMVTSPEGKRYYLGFSDWDAVHEWQKAQPKAAQQIILLRFDDYANMIAKNAEASGLVINPGDNSLRLERPLIESVKRRRTRFPKDRSAAGRAAGPPHPSRRQGHAGRAQHAARRHDRPGLRGAGRRPRCGLCLSVRYDRKR